MSFFTRISSSASTSADTTAETESTTTTTTLTSNQRSRRTHSNRNNNHISNNSFVILATNRDDDVVEEIDSQRGRSCDTTSSYGSEFEEFVGDGDHSLIFRSAAVIESQTGAILAKSQQQQQDQENPQQKISSVNNHKDPSVKSSPRLDFVVVPEEDNDNGDDEVVEGNDEFTSHQHQQQQQQQAQQQLMQQPEKNENENPKNGNDDQTAAVVASQKTTTTSLKPLQNIEIEDPYKTGKWTIEKLRELNRATFNNNNSNNNNNNIVTIDTTLVPLAICKYHLAKENIEVIRPFGKSTLLCRQWEGKNNNNNSKIIMKNDDKRQNNAIVTITRGQDATKCALTFFHFYLPSDEEHAMPYITQVRQIPRCPSIVTGVAARKRTDGVFEIETEFMDGGSLDRFICGCSPSKANERPGGEDDDEKKSTSAAAADDDDHGVNVDATALPPSVLYQLPDADRTTLTKSVARQILLGLCFIHVVLGKSHRSLSTKTILFRRDGRAKIQSYDTLTKSEISARFDNNNNNNNSSSSSSPVSNYANEFLRSAFLAPELATSSNSKSFETASTFSTEGKSDVWSLGICLLCIALNIPFKDMIVEQPEKQQEQNENIRLVERLITANESATTSEGDELWRAHVSPNDIALRFLIRRCLAVDPKKRISVVEAFALTFVVGRTDKYQDYQEQLVLREKSKSENQDAASRFSFARDPFVTPVDSFAMRPALPSRFPFIGREIKKVINLDEEGHYFIPQMIHAIPNEMQCLLPRTTSASFSASHVPSGEVFSFCGAKKIDAIPQFLQQQQTTSTGFHYLDEVVQQLNQEFINHRLIRHSADDEAKENLRKRRKNHQLEKNQNQPVAEQDQNGEGKSNQQQQVGMLQLSTKADEESSVLGRDLREIWKARLAPATSACEKILSDFRAKKQK